MVVLRNVPQLTRNPGAVPPPLPPSVEEAYRRKCIQLKQRMNEVEETNDASRQRIVRMERSIQKMRLERAFLLEQLSKRTSTNVEDSEGSPSPPPTVCQTLACA
jgi:non-histone protein 10